MPASPEPISVLLVDDEPELLRMYAELIDARAGMRCVGTRERAEDLAAAAEALGATILVCDLSMPGTPPLRALAALQDEAPRLRSIVISGHRDQASIDAAVEAGAWGYVCKYDGEQALLEAIERVAAGEFVLPEG